MPATCETLVARQKKARHRIAKLVLDQHRLRRELLDLAKQIGHAQNAVDIGTEISAMAATDVERLSKTFCEKLKIFELNEFEKINARIDVLNLELEIAKS